MKQFLYVFALILSGLQYTSFFNIGNQRFASEKPPEGQTRAQWYQDSLKKSEKFLRNAILTTLKIRTYFG